MTSVNVELTSSVLPDNQVEDIAHKGDTLVQNPRWYILRYKNLTARIKDNLFSTSLEVFFPCRKVMDAQKSTGKCYTFDKPIVPGYVFVHAAFHEAKSFVQDTGLFLWRKSLADSPALSESLVLSPAEQRIKEESMYYSVSDAVMKTFIQVVDYHRNDIKLYDATDIDVEQNDEVEFISGPMKGRHGYVRTEMRKGGGIVIMPLVADYDEETSKPVGDGMKSGNDRYVAGRRKHTACLHYGIPAKAEEYRIVRFANNTRNGDSMKRATQRSRELLESYRKGAELAEKDRKRMKGYILRYSDTEMETAIQKANRALLLYRIYTILETQLKLAEVQSDIEKNVIPAFDQRIVTARGAHRVRIEKRKKSFLTELEYIGGSRNERQNYMKVHCSEFG